MIQVCGLFTSLHFIIVVDITFDYKHSSEAGIVKIRSVTSALSAAWTLVKWLVHLLLEFVHVTHFLYFRYKAQTAGKSGKQICTDKSSSEIRTNKDHQVSFSSCGAPLLVYSLKDVPLLGALKGFGLKY